MDCFITTHHIIPTNFCNKIELASQVIFVNIGPLLNRIIMNKQIYLLYYWTLALLHYYDTLSKSKREQEVRGPQINT